jgi:hypothetical protein
MLSAQHESHCDGGDGVGGRREGSTAGYGPFAEVALDGLAKDGGGPMVITVPITRCIPVDR